MIAKNTIYRFLLIAFLFPYVAWGIVLLAQEMGWFQYGTPVSILLVTFGANCPAIAAYFAIKKADPSFTMKQYLKDAFGVKQKASFYAITLSFVVIFFGLPALMGGIATQLSPFSGGTEAHVAPHIAQYQVPSASLRILLVICVTLFFRLFSGVG